MYVFVGWSYNRAERERTITKAQKREREEEKEKITHVLAIKDGPGLEENEEEESHMRTAAATIYSLLFSFCFLSTGQSISHL
jgi:hypothetical protein